MREPFDRHQAAGADRCSSWLCGLPTAGRWLAALLVIASATADVAVAQDAPRMLKWADLVPPAKVGAKPASPKSFLANRPKDASPVPGGIGAVPGTEHNPQVAEGKWLSPGALPQPGAGTPPEVVEALDGQRVTIGGYVVPLDFDATKVKEFLLVPFVGACIHVPPPPSNQLVYVKHEPGFEVKASFDPVWVTGKMQAKVAFTGLAEAGYSIQADKVEARKE